MEEKVAVLVQFNVFRALQEYLAGRPFAEVQAFFEAFKGASALTKEDLEKLQAEKEEAPE